MTPTPPLASTSPSSTGTSSARVDLLIALGLSIAAVIVLAVTSQDLGFTRDEGYYFKAAELYWNWFKAPSFDPAVIDKWWGYNHEHPAILKSLFAISYGISSSLGLPFQTHNAMRFPAWCVSGATVAIVYALTRSLLSRRAAIVASLMWIAMPHVFWHMHLSCFDVGVCGAHAMLVLAYVRWRHTAKGALLVGIVFGLCAGVKHNVIPVPALLVMHWLLCEASTQKRAVPLVFLSMAIVGPVVYVLHWPWLWPHPAERFAAYVAYHLNHENYPILYFGDLLTHPPFPISFPFVMSAVTIPVPILVAMIAGFALACIVGVRFLVARIRSATHTNANGAVVDVEMTRVPLGDVARFPSANAAILLAMNAAYPFLLIALPSTPKFGGTKHWMNALPFLCVLAAWALEEGFARLQAAAVLKSAASSAWTYVVVAALAVVPGFVISARVWPYGLGSYNELIGFVRGAANVGMQRTFWGYEPMLALDEINARTRKNGRIHFGDTNFDDYKMYERDHLLRPDIGFSNTVRGAAVASVQPQGEFKEQWTDVWNEWDDRSPDLVLGPEGVPVLTVTFHEASK